VRAFQNIADITLVDTNIELTDGESLSGSTKRMSIVNEEDDAEFGRKIDVLVNEEQYHHVVEFCGIEFKTEEATDNILSCQHSKNARINSTMLNGIIKMIES
jgi:Fe-S cluster assembly scaffold protein SufB